MSERILKALMHLFAVIAGPRLDNKAGRSIVETFLRQQLNEELVDEYLKLFDGYFALYQRKHSEEGKKAKNLSLSSVKVLKICTQINEELDLRQKVVVLIRLLEFIKGEFKVSVQELEFVYTVSDIFRVSHENYEFLKNYVLSSFDEMPLSARMLLIDGFKTTSKPEVRHFYQEYFLGKIWVTHYPAVDMYLARYFGENELYLNGQLIQSERVYILSPGSAFRDSKMQPVYYSDIISSYYVYEFEQRILFEVKDVEYHFKGGKKGLNTVNFIEESGSLVGIMGASGAGKSTLLNVLNGSYPPSSGSICINGVNIHTEKEKVEGLIGFVSQDDLLIEELTVYQNLYFNAKLCFDNLSSFQLNRKVYRTLQSLGLFEIKDMVVGNPLNKKISGGQRKRLNIALELIREPSILFLDEPTSGLSSRDSENIMDLLKELALKGKLIFVVIHQPSSDIFKMFDKLIILDVGGYMIYKGNPVDSIMYFKSKVHQANWNDSECRTCGNVNPEQIFNIIESRALDEYGNVTQERRKTPREWYRYYIDSHEPKPEKEKIVGQLPKVLFRIPGKFRQFKVFVIRDVLSKLSNRQYMVLNITETPVLAFLLSFIVRYFAISEGEGYHLSGNPNLPVYIFMSVIVAIFVGLTVSAEEIIRDQKILKREKFLNLSRSSYLWSKVAILLGISAFQSFMFVLLGNFIMGINGMFFEFWLVLFSAWFFACMGGLIISDSFNTVVTIYILIPFLVIPQLIMSGVIVSFDKLNPYISKPTQIPWYGEIITSRWAYEALAVNQYIQNEYEFQFYPYDKVKSEADYKKNYWLKTLTNRLSSCERNYKNPVKQLQVKDDLKLLHNEISKELAINPRIEFKYLHELRYERLSKKVFDETQNYLSQLNTYYLKKYNKASQLKDDLINRIQDSLSSKEEFLRLKKIYTNENLSTFVRNANSLERIIQKDNQLYQKIDPIYLDPEPRFIKAHFYAPRKWVFGRLYNTFYVNVVIIWLYSALLYLVLHYRLLRRTINYFSKDKKD